MSEEANVEELVSALSRGEPCGVSRCRDTSDPRACMCAQAAATITSLSKRVEEAEGFDNAIAQLWERYPGWKWLVRCSDDCAAFWARIESPDYEAVTWEAGDRIKTDVLAGRDATSGWCSTPAEAIEHAMLVLEAHHG